MKISHDIRDEARTRVGTETMAETYRDGGNLYMNAEDAAPVP